MDVQVATLCDSAADYNGKLCVLGAFDTIFARSFPVVHPQCAIALRICFRPDDAAALHFRISIIDADGKDVIPAIEPTVEVKVPPDTVFMTRNLVMNLQRLKFQQAGQFSVDITCEGRMVARIPMRVLELENAKGST